jgi:quinol monooxygenase YgiN
MHVGEQQDIIFFTSEVVTRIYMYTTKKSLLAFISNLTRQHSIVLVCILIFFFYSCASAQNKQHMVRLAKIVIDSAQLDNYKVFAKEEIETSLRVEPGVLTLFAVSEKDNPTHITILEIYADTAAYKQHIKTPHFLKYKNGTLHMVKSLELVEADPLIPGARLKETLEGN